MAWIHLAICDFMQERGGDAVDTYEILSLLFLGGTFLVALPACIDRNNKRK